MHLKYNAFPVRMKSFVCSSSLVTFYFFFLFAPPPFFYWYVTFCWCILFCIFENIDPMVLCQCTLQRPLRIHV